MNLFVPCACRYLWKQDEDVESHGTKVTNSELYQVQSLGPLQEQLVLLKETHNENNI